MTTFPDEYLKRRAESAGFATDDETLEKVQALATAIHADVVNGHRDVPPPPCPKQPERQT